MKIKLNSDIIKIIISAVLFVLALFLEDYRVVYLILLIISYIVVAYEIFIEAFKKLLKGNGRL